MNPNHIYAPFTPTQVVALNAFQDDPHTHGFTCGNAACGTDMCCCEGLLIATTAGWHCPHQCGYTQNWAHAWMADGTWRTSGTPRHCRGTNA